MKLELVLKKATEKTAPKGSESAHHLDFRFTGVYMNTLLHIEFSPELAIVYAQRGDPSYAWRIRHFVGRAKTSWGDVLARVVAENSGELLDREGGLVDAVRNCFPDVRMTAANEEFFRELSRSLSCAVDDYTALARGIPDTGIKGENVAGFLLNEQGKLFPLSFYSHVKRGYKFSRAQVAFGEPAGIWKGILLRAGYQHYERKDHPEIVLYFPQSAQPPPGMVQGRPF